MPSSPSPSLRLEEQFTGENVNLWGVLLNAAITLLDASIAGISTVNLTSTNPYALTSKNYVADEARPAILKFTGSPATVTIPSVSKVYIAWNATSGVVILTTGSGTTVSIDTTDIVLVLCDGINVTTLGYGGLSLKAFIAASALGATGSLPAVTGNAGKFVYTDGASSFWKAVSTTDLSDYSTKIVGQQVALAIALGAR